MTSRSITRAALFAAVTAASLAAAPARAVSLGQSDSFEDGSTQAWRAGPAHPLPPTVISTGGPGGAGDAYLRVQAIGGAGPASRLAVENNVQWTGDYIAAGVTALTLDAFNFGPADLSLRLLFDGSDGTNFARAWSTTAVLLPAGSGWQPLRFAITPADLTVEGGGSVTLALTQTYSIRLFHGTASDFPGGVVAATLGIDNVTAVPEPAAGLLMALGLGAVLWLRRRPAAAA